MSTDFAQEDSPVTQDDHTGEFIRAQGLHWTRTYYDLGVSAGTVDKRPGLLQLMADAERERPACIVFYKLDRSFRNSYEQGTALRLLKRAGVRVLKVRDPNITGPQGEMVDGILGIVNQFERQITGVRIRDHNLTMARQGLWSTGRVPYGYRYIPAVREQHGRKRITVQEGRVEQHPDEWPAARQIWEWALQGLRKSEIVALANEAGYRRRQGGLWTTEEISRILASKVYAGYVPYSSEPRTKSRSPRLWTDTDWFPGQHPAMVTLEQWHRVQAMLHAPAGAHRQPNKSPLAELAGLIRCRICGGPVTSVGRDRVNSYYYGCQVSSKGGGGHRYWTRAPWLVHMAVQAVLDRAVADLPPVPSPAGSDDQREAITREIARLHEQRERLKDLYLMGEFNRDKDAYQRRARALDAQIAAREAALAESGPPPDVLASMHERLRTWEHAYLALETVAERQRFWGSLVESIRMDQTSMHVRLHDIDPAISREWDVQLPPARARRPGSACGRGVAGQRGSGPSRSWMTTGLVVSPVKA